MRSSVRLDRKKGQKVKIMMFSNIHLTISEFIDMTFTEKDYIGFIAGSEYTYIDYNSETDVINKLVKPYFLYDDNCNTIEKLYIYLIEECNIELTESLFLDIKDTFYTLIAYGIIDISEKTGWV